MFRGFCVHVQYQYSTHLQPTSFNVFFIFLIYFLHCRLILKINTEDIKTMKEYIWNYVVNKKTNQNMFYILDSSK